MIWKKRATSNDTIAASKPKANLIIQYSRTMGDEVEVVVSGVESLSHDVPNRFTGETIVIVLFEGDDDPMHPYIWKLSRRLLATAIVSLIGAVLGFASGVDAGITGRLMVAFGGSYVLEAFATIGETVSSTLMMHQGWRCA